MLNTDDASDLQKLLLALKFQQLENTATQLHTKKIAEVLSYYQDRIRINNDLFALTPLNMQISQAAIIDEHAPNMSIKDKYVFVYAPIALNLAFEKDYFLLCLKSVADSKIRLLPSEPAWLHAKASHLKVAAQLEAAELLSHNVSLYAWLSFKFPQIFTEGEKVRQLRTLLSNYINSALLIQNGYGDTSRELDLIKY